jgi:hypothetical protein
MTDNSWISIDENCSPDLPPTCVLEERCHHLTHGAVTSGSHQGLGTVQLQGLTHQAVNITCRQV